MVIFVIIILGIVLALLVVSAISVIRPPKNDEAVGPHKKFICPTNCERGKTYDTVSFCPVCHFRMVDTEKAEADAKKAKLDSLRNWSEEKYGIYTIECSCRCGGRVLWTRYVSSNAICNSLCPDGMPCR